MAEASLCATQRQVTAEKRKQKGNFSNSIEQNSCINVPVNIDTGEDIFHLEISLASFT